MHQNNDFKTHYITKKNHLKQKHIETRRIRKLFNCPRLNSRPFDKKLIIRFSNLNSERKFRSEPTSLRHENWSVQINNRHLGIFECVYGLKV